MTKAGEQGAEAATKDAPQQQGEAAAEERPQEAERAENGKSEQQHSDQAPAEQKQPEPAAKEQKAAGSDEAGASNQPSPQPGGQQRSPSDSPQAAVATPGRASHVSPVKMPQLPLQPPPQPQLQALASGKAAEDPKEKPSEESKGKAAEETKGGANDGQVEKILEEGRIFFLYRPKVAVKAAKSVAQLQRFFLVLQPEGRARKRLIIIGKKRLPSAERRERYFGFVAGADDSMKALLSDLGPQSYETATQGERHLEGARVAGEGHYALVVKQGSGTFLAWTLEVPAEPGQVQKDLRIGKQGSLALSIKNPKRDDARIGLEQKADYGEKQAAFKNYAWIAATDPAMLDVKNAELLFIGASTDLEGEFGAAFGSHMAEKAAEDAAAAAGGAEEEAGDEEMVDALKEELKTEQLHLETAPAAEKQWV